MKSLKELLFGAAPRVRLQPMIPFQSVNLATRDRIEQCFYKTVSEVCATHRGQFQSVKPHEQLSRVDTGQLLSSTIRLLSRALC